MLVLIAGFKMGATSIGGDAAQTNGGTGSKLPVL